MVGVGVGENMPGKGGGGGGGGGGRPVGDMQHVASQSLQHKQKRLNSPSVDSQPTAKLPGQNRGQG